MTRAELIALASPPCSGCAAPIERVEMSWTRQGDDWVPARAFVVCGNNHRVEVVPFKGDDDG